MRCSLLNVGRTISIRAIIEWLPAILSVNLDLFMMSEAHVHDLYAGYTEKADVAVTEGVMGLFDGYDGMKGSSAEIACLLKIPVVLIVNAKSTAYSVAPLLYGFKHFKKQVQVVGAVFNFVASESHYSFLKQACEDAGVEALGYLPKCADVEIPSRHLGLSLDEDFCFEEFADRVAELVEKYVDIDRLLELTKQVAPAALPMSVSHRTYRREPSFTVAIARDPAFNFMYEANIRYLHHLGEVTYFSPLADTSLPDTGFVYLPGGYPELYLAALSANRPMLQSIRRYVENGGKLLAECGGMMYLCDEIRDKNGDVYPMAGVLHQSATMENMKLRLGYRTLLYDDARLKGHEFHYSRLVERTGSASVLRCRLYGQRSGNGYPALSLQECLGRIYAFVLGSIRLGTTGLPNLSLNENIYAWRR